jgi:hypothetical protein
MANPRTPERSCFDVALCRQLVPAALSFFLEENGSDLTQQAVYFVFRSEADIAVWLIYSSGIRSE